MSLNAGLRHGLVSATIIQGAVPGASAPLHTGFKVPMRAKISVEPSHAVPPCCGSRAIPGHDLPVSGQPFL